MPDTWPVTVKLQSITESQTSPKTSRAYAIFRFKRGMFFRQIFERGMFFYLLGSGLVGKSRRY